MQGIIWSWSWSLGLGIVAGAAAKAIPQQPLRFTKEGTFQISLFSDLHYGEAENLDWGPQQDVNSTRVMNSVLNVEKPQLVVLNGDLITGENTYLANSSAYIDEIVRPLVARGLAWASTYGNHDSDVNLSRWEILAREKRYVPYSLTQSMVPGPNAGVSNYYLPVFTSNYPFDQVPKAILWFFDSRGGNYFQQRDEDGNGVPQPGWVDESVANWFTQTNSYLTQLYGKTIPSLAFYHIPVNAMLAFQQGPQVDPNKEPGINDDNPLAQQGLTSGQGKATGTFTYDGQDMPFMKALLSTKGLMATFSGHDHGDDWCFKWNSKLPGMNVTGNGIVLCFDRHSGYGGYGTWTRGSRQILLDEKTLGSQTSTWVRLEDETISGKVTLNATYGQDHYPAVADTDT